MLTSIAPQGTSLIPTAYAEEQQTGISKEEAIKSATKWVTIPNDYKLENASYFDEKREYYTGKTVWRLSWQKNREGFISASALHVKKK